MNILISGIVNHFNQAEISNDELIKDCMNELFENGRPAFNFMTIHDPMFTKHSSDTNYQKTRDADIQEITRQTAKFLNEESIQPGTYEGENARKIIDKILEFRLQKLDDELKKYNIVKLSPFLLRMQGNVIEARGIAQKRAMNDMPQIEEFDPISWHHEKAGELSKVGETIRYISERALQLNPHGDDYLTQEKWLEIQAMGELIVYITSVRNVIYYEVGVFKLRISDDYWYEIVGEDTENLAQHMANFNMFMLKSSKNSIHLNSEKETEFYQKINEPFKEEFKVTFESFLKILLDCIEFPLTKDQHNAIVSEQEIIAFIKKQNPEMPEDEIIAGLSLASISSEELKSIQIFATDTRNRKVRSIVKPLIKLEDSGTKYVINSWLTRVSRFQWSDYVDKGHLPFKVSYITTSGSLEITLNDIQHEVAKELENATGKIVSNFADVYDKNIKEDHRCFSSLSNFPGELDVLGIFVKHKKVILFEVKHANINFSALDFSNEIKKFTNSNGYQNILLNKKSFLEQNLQEILRCYEIEMKGEWTVETMFVSNTFHFNISNLQIPIVLLDDLEKMLNPIHS